MVWKTPVVTLGGFKEDVLSVENRVVTDIDGGETLVVEILAGVFGANVGFGLVVHVVGEDGGRRSTATPGSAEDLGDKESLVSVVEGADGEFEFVAVVNHGFEIGDGVAVSVDVDLATESGAQRFPEEFLGEVVLYVLDTDSLGFGAPVILLLDELLSLLKSVTELKALTHAAVWSTRFAAVDSLGVLTTSHFHVAPLAARVSKHIFSADFTTAIGLANGMFDDERFTAHVVTRAWENKRCSDTSSLDDLDLGVKWVDAVNGTGPGCDVV